MLWDLIRDFFVQHVFGGYDSEGNAFSTFIGKLKDVDGAEDLSWAESIWFTIDSNGNQLALGDWLSTTATAISITIIVVLCCLFIYKIVRLIGGLIR